MKFQGLRGRAIFRVMIDDRCMCCCHRYDGFDMTVDAMELKLDVRSIVLLDVTKIEQRAPGRKILIKLSNNLIKFNSCPSPGHEI